MSAKQSHLYVVGATDALMIEESVSVLLNEVAQGAEISKYEYDPDEFATILNTLRSHSLFGLKQVVVLHRAEKMPVADQKLLAALPSLNCVILEVELKVQEVQKKFKTLAAYIYRSQGPVYDDQLPSWVQARFAKKCKGSITRDAAEALIAFTGNQLTIIDKELDNLLLFAGETIQADDVRALLDRDAESDVFDLIDAVALQDRSRALSSLWREIRAGTEVVAIVAMLSMHFLRLPDAKRSTKPAAGFYLQKLAKQANAFSTEKLKDILLSLAVVERRVKSEPATVLIIEELILIITQERTIIHG